jgi:translation initiation factor 3 subunit B
MTNVFDPRYPHRKPQSQKTAAQRVRQDAEFDEPPPIFDDNYDNILIVDGLPVVPETKIDKLKDFLRSNAFGSKKIPALGSGRVIDIHLPTTEVKGKLKTCGYGFIEYESSRSAEIAMKARNGKALDAKHNLRVFRYSDFDRILGTPDDFETPDPASFQSESKNFYSWLSDDFGRDQFVLRYAEETMVCWNDPIRRSAAQGGIELAFDGKREKKTSKGIVKTAWTKKHVRWSPQGSYLATFHDQGIAIWGGPDFAEIARFEHDRVSEIDFSPCEKFLVTASWLDQKECKIIVWDIARKCVKVNASTAANIAPIKREFRVAGDTNWPAFQWSHDDKYFSRLSKNRISIYSTPTFNLLNKQHMDIKGVADMQWSPGANMFAYWIPEVANQPATIAVRELSDTSRNILREKSLYSVDSVSLFWQSTGEFLCVRVARRKSRKTLTTNFEIFRCRDRDIPVEVVELGDPNVVAFAWEPRGRTFAVVHTATEGGRQGISFFKVKNKKTALLTTLTDRFAEALYWSPIGQYIVFAALGSRGHLEFYDVKNNQKLSEQEHFKCSHVEWDPSGRFVSSIAAQPLSNESWAYAAENGYKMWTFQGEFLHNILKDSLYQFIWRPRPKCLLSNQQQATIKKNLRQKYWNEFENEAREIKVGNQSAEVTLRKQRADEWRRFKRACNESYENERGDRENLRKGVLSDDEDDYVMQDVTVQTLISLVETPLVN